MMIKEIRGITSIFTPKSQHNHIKLPADKIHLLGQVTFKTKSGQSDFDVFEMTRAPRSFDQAPMADILFISKKDEENPAYFASIMDDMVYSYGCGSKTCGTTEIKALTIRDVISQISEGLQDTDIGNLIQKVD